MPSILKARTLPRCPANPAKVCRLSCQSTKCHYHFTVKGNQPTILQDISLYFKEQNQPDFVAYTPPDHGRIEIRKIWVTSELNGYLDFPHVGQAFVIERESINKKTGKHSIDTASGITSRTPEQANAGTFLIPTVSIGVLRIVVITL